MRTWHAIGFAAAALLAGCSSEWTGYVYPNKHNLADSQSIGNFTSLESCRYAALQALSNLPGGRERGDYECGENCKGNLCERTSR